MLKQYLTCYWLLFSTLALLSCTDNSETTMSPEDVYYLVSSEIDPNTEQEKSLNISSLIQQLEQATFNITAKQINRNDALTAITTAQKTIIYGDMPPIKVVSLNLQNANLQTLLASLLEDEQYITDYKLNDGKYRLHRLWINTSPEQFISEHAQPVSEIPEDQQNLDAVQLYADQSLSENLIQFTDIWAYSSEEDKSELLYKMELSEEILLWLTSKMDSQTESIQTKLDIVERLQTEDSLGAKQLVLTLLNNEHPDIAYNALEIAETWSDISIVSYIKPLSGHHNQRISELASTILNDLNNLTNLGHYQPHETNTELTAQDRAAMEAKIKQVIEFQKSRRQFMNDQIRDQ